MRILQISRRRKQNGLTLLIGELRGKTTFFVPVGLLENHQRFIFGNQMLLGIRDELTNVGIVLSPVGAEAVLLKFRDRAAVENITQRRIEFLWRTAMNGIGQRYEIILNLRPDITGHLAVSAGGVFAGDLDLLIVQRLIDEGKIHAGDDIVRNVIADAILHHVFAEQQEQGNDEPEAEDDRQGWEQIAHRQGAARFEIVASLADRRTALTGSRTMFEAEHYSLSFRRRLATGSSPFDS